jgi:uncharacterized protein YtpQ (UPF0354 family)
VRAVLIFAVCLVLLAGASACDDKGNASPQTLSRIDFKNKAAAAIIEDTDLKADPNVSPRVEVTAENSLNTLSLDIAAAYAAYKKDPANLDRILADFAKDADERMAAGNEGKSFSGVRSQILPLLKPEQSFRRLSEQPFTVTFPGDLRVVYVVQAPDSMTFITKADLESWKHSAARVDELALSNLLRQTKRTQPLRCEQKLCGWASGDGYDAARMLVPQLRAEIVRKIGPAVYAVPRESVYVALPIKLAGRIKDKVEHDFVTAPNPVSRNLFVERGGDLVVLSK